MDSNFSKMRTSTPAKKLLSRKKRTEECTQPTTPSLPPGVAFEKAEKDLRIANRIVDAALAKLPLTRMLKNSAYRNLDKAEGRAHRDRHARDEVRNPSKRRLRAARARAEFAEGMLEKAVWERERGGELQEKVRIRASKAWARMDESERLATGHIGRPGGDVEMS